MRHVAPWAAVEGFDIGMTGVEATQAYFSEFM